MARTNWHDSHPPGCTCYWCNEGRAGHRPRRNTPQPVSAWGSGGGRGRIGVAVRDDDGGDGGGGNGGIGGPLVTLVLFVLVFVLVRLFLNGEIRSSIGDWWENQTSPSIVAPPASPPQPPTVVPLAPTPPPTPLPTRTPSAVIPPSPTVEAIPVATLTPDLSTAFAPSLDRFTNGDWLEQSDSPLASSIKDLEWFRDGTDDVESEAIQDVLFMAADSVSLARSVVELQWFQNGIDDVEGEAVRSLANFRKENVTTVAEIVDLFWVQDGVSGIESEVLENLSYIAYDSGMTVAKIVDFEWVRDGIADMESEAIDWLANFSADGVPTVDELVSKAWMQDGVEANEMDAVKFISFLAFRHAAAAHQTIGMPFMASIEAGDVAALDSLRRLGRNDPGWLALVLGRLGQAGGITDEMAPIVATFGGVQSTNPGVMEKLLNPNQLILERRSISLPMAGDVELVIIRTRPGAARSMDLLELAVRSAEEFMNVPLPTDLVTLLYEDAVNGTFAGTNFGTHIAIRPKYDVDDGSQEAEFAASNIAHEVAHYYWSGNEDWVDEGAADLMASVSEERRTGLPVGVTNPPCPYARTISEFESIGSSRGDRQFTCNYALGERLFVDLYHTMGEERFREAFSALYLASEVEDDADDYTGTSVGIVHVREALGIGETVAGDVIARWYDGSVPHDLSRLDTSPVDPKLPSINGRIDFAHIAFGRGEPAKAMFSSRDTNGWALLVLNFSYEVRSVNEEVHLRVVEFYEDGVEFRRRHRTIEAEAGYIGSTYWFSVGTSPSRDWAPGRYYVYVYDGDRKVAEVQYTVTP